MWAKLSSALKSTTARPQLSEEPRPTTPVHFGLSRAETPQSIGRSQAEVTAHLLGECRSDSPAFGVPSTSHIPPVPQSSPPPSPSRRSLFKRSKEMDSLRGASASLKLLPKKIRGSLPFGNASQSSLASSTDTHQSAATSTNPVTQHKLHSSQDTLRSFASAVRRPSLDILRSVVQENSNTAQPFIADSVKQPQQSQCSSVRSILRDPKTPGTGQSVRFFSRDAYKVISPEESMDENFLTPPQQVRIPEQTSFIDRLNQANFDRTDTPITRLSSPQSKSRPSLNGIFGPIETPKKDDNYPDSDAQSHTSDSSAAMSLASSSPFNANGSLDMPNPLDLPAFPPGLDFEVASSLGSAIDLDLSMDGDAGAATRMTSTPCKPGRWNEKEGSIQDEEDETEEGRVREMVFDETVSIQHSIQPAEDEIIYHSLERPPVVSPPPPPERSQSPLERSQSFSFGQTVFHSMGNSANALSPPNNNNNGNPPPSVNGPIAFSSPPGSMSRHRGRALSDTVFQSMLRSSSPVFKPPRNSAPEADIHDDASQKLVVYSPNPASTEPDPFNAKANTYYTPQTMIPTTPPPGIPRHTRKTSKEESLIYSLQTQLALQQELCSQFEADLRTKDEMMELLGKKVSDMEKLEVQRKGVLRQWKKKVQELERSCRLLEEEVDTSRQESMERSVMDEASGEALRMLHRQIATLEQEKAEGEKREQMLRVENETLQSLIKERSQYVVNLKEAMWSRDEVLDQGLKKAKEQVDMMGNISLVGVDEDELKRLAEREKKADEEREVYRAREMEWEQERMELVTKIEEIYVEKMGVEEQVEALKEQINVKEEEFEVMESELEAQWGHTETASDTIQELRKAKEEAEEDIAKLRREKEGLEKERDELATKYGEVEQKVENMEVDWNESENRRMELESEVNELLDLKDAMEKERKQVEDKLSQERVRSDDLNRALQQCDDRIIRLEHESQLSAENVTHLENDIRRRDNEIAQYNEKLHAQQLESRNLRAELEELTQEHTRLIDEQSQASTHATGSETEGRKQIQDLVRQKTESENQLKSTKERMDSLKNEMDRLRKHVHDLQQESADKEVKMTQMTKQHVQDKEDIQGLNIALDAKQQELELYKRKVAIKPSSSASGTPAATSSSSKVINRRTSSSLADGSTLATARPPSRAASVISDAGSARGHTEKISALGRSSRVNTLNGTSTSSATGALAAKKRAEGTTSAKTTAALRSSISPPPASMKRTGVRSPTTGTRTVATPATARRAVSGNGDKAKLTTMTARRASIMSPTPSISESSEKENNMDDTVKIVRRRSMVPVSG